MQKGALKGFPVQNVLQNPCINAKAACSLRCRSRASNSAAERSAEVTVAVAELVDVGVMLSVELLVLVEDLELLLVLV